MNGDRSWYPKRRLVIGLRSEIPIALDLYEKKEEISILKLPIKCYLSHPKVSVYWIVPLDFKSLAGESSLAVIVFSLGKIKWHVFELTPKVATELWGERESTL
jgi:hypothetical protein